MYTIVADGILVYDPRIEDLRIMSANLRKENNMADNFRFSLHPENVMAGRLEKFKTIVEVFDNGKRIFRGRILNSETDIRNIKRYVCEGELAFLSDSIVRPYAWNTGGVDSYFRFLVDQHNAQVNASHSFTVRDVTVQENANTGNIIRSSSIYPTTLAEIKDKLVVALGGHLVLEHINGTTYIDYLQESLKSSKQSVELGKNIVDLLLETRGEDVATGVIPLGSDIFDTEDSEASARRLTIEDVNDGADYIYCPEAVAKYGGMILRTAVFEDITLPENLLRAGRNFLANITNPLASLTLTAVDLNALDINIDTIDFLDYVQVSSKLHGLTGEMLVVSKRIDLLDASQTKLVLGSEFGSFVQSNTNLADRVTVIESNQQIEVVTNLNAKVVSLDKRITALSDDKADRVHKHLIEDVEGLTEILDRFLKYMESEETEEVEDE